MAEGSCMGKEPTVATPRNRPVVAGWANQQALESGGCGSGIMHRLVRAGAKQGVSGSLLQQSRACPPPK